MNESRILSVVGNDLGVAAGCGMYSSLHAPHGIELCIGLERELSVRTGDGGSVRGRVIAVPPDLDRRIESEGVTLAMLYDVEPFPSLAGFARRTESPIVLDGPLARRVIDAARAQRDSLFRAEVLRGLAEELAGYFSGERPRRIDPRVGRAVEALRAHDLRRGEIIAASGLSEPHLQALFVRDIGISMRRFRLWQRMLSAVIALRRVDCTRAAHDAGFADLAHFSRTCARLLGYPPRTMRAAFTGELLRLPARVEW
ncbi:MAG TPA: AraC family transcriptional regulator [Polyangiaceae bacterium]|nr:AraC family transcriptional regulator [Polyangiaceae bacterium]